VKQTTTEYREPDARKVAVSIRNELWTALKKPKNRSNLHGEEC
jgi:hypothetical protein